VKLPPAIVGVAAQEAVAECTGASEHSTHDMRRLLVSIPIDLVCSGARGRAD
jgi:hypothetical protein